MNRSLSYLFLLLTILTLCLIKLPLASAANLAQSYVAASSLTNGSIVSIDPHSSDHILPSNTVNASGLIGVAIVSNNAQFTKSNPGSSVQVAINGTVNALVSTINGPIKVGDQVSPSPFNGIGMVALPGSYIAGLAQTPFNSSTPGAITETVKNNKNQISHIKVGYIRLSIAVGTYSTNGNETGQNGLQKFVQDQLGHSVPTIRIVMSIVVAVVSLFALLALIYASIYSSIISIGRNPLAKITIFKTLGIVLVVAILTTIVATTTIYFLLK
jgi:hypothetical protein